MAKHKYLDNWISDTNSYLYIQNSNLGLFSTRVLHYDVVGSVLQSHLRDFGQELKEVPASTNIYIYIYIY